MLTCPSKIGPDDKLGFPKGEPNEEEAVQRGADRADSAGGGDVDPGAGYLPQALYFDIPPSLTAPCFHLPQNMDATTILTQGGTGT